MPVIINRLFGFEGPNIVSPQPGVLLEARADCDLGAALRNAIKDVGQQIGMVVAALEIQVAPALPGFDVRAFFATPTPGLGKATIQFIVDGFNARDAGVDWEEDDRLEALQERRRNEALSFAALQIVAEANKRGVPAFRRADGMLQVGYGTRGSAIDISNLPIEQRRDGESILRALPWERLGVISIIATCGIDVGFVASEISAALPELQIGVVAGATFHAARDLLAQPHLDLAILDLAPADLLHLGLPFDQCMLAAVGRLPQHLLQARDEHEIVRAIALPMLVATNQIFIAATLQHIRELAPLFAAPVMTIETNRLAQTIVQHATRLLADE